MSKGSAAMHGYSIREADQTDCELIRQLASQVWFVTYRDVHTQEQLEYMFEEMYEPCKLEQQMEAGHAFFIGYDQQIPFGYFSIEQKDTNLFYLQKLYVLPAWQGKGAGKFLFLSAVDRIKKQHPRRCLLELNVNRQNPAIHFYERMGMIRYKESDDPIGEGFIMNNCFMRMEI